MIQLEHVRKEFPASTPLTDVNATINNGEIISIIGPSGTGKSTLLRCINMLAPPTSGRILIDGEDITAKGCKLNLYRKKMGMVFQQFNLFEHMNAIENITYAPIKLLGLSKEEAEEKALGLLKKVGLADKGRAYPDELSGGQKQRIAIARALAMDPEILLFDEPTSALDPTMVGEVLALIRMLSGSGITMLIVTHEMKFARDVSTRIFYMDQGIIYEDGTPEQIFDHPKNQLTRQFVQKLKVIEKELLPESFDFLGFNSELEEFGRKSLMSPRGIVAAQTILEELCLQTMIMEKKIKEKILFSLEYDEKTDRGSVRVDFGGSEYNPVAEMDDISRLLIENMTESIDYDYDGETNRIRIKLKMQSKSPAK